MRCAGADIAWSATILNGFAVSIEMPVIATLLGALAFCLIGHS